jgi:TDG/mug DNA glycosylase family protein
VTPLPDVVAPGLRLLVVGLNPGHYSAWYGMYFARPANRLWWGLRRAGIVPPTAGPGSEAWLLREHGIGFTDVVKRPTRRAEEVTSDEWAEGARRLRRLLIDLRPGAVCFVGLRGARAVLGPGVTVGPQPEAVAGIPAFVLPSTSPRQAGYPARRLAELFRDLGRWWRTLPLREPSSPRSGS